MLITLVSVVLADSRRRAEKAAPEGAKSPGRLQVPPEEEDATGVPQNSELISGPFRFIIIVL